MPKTRAFHREKPGGPDRLDRRPTCPITRDHNHELLSLPHGRTKADWDEHYQIAQRWHEDLTRKGVPHRLETEADGRIKQILLHRVIGAYKNGTQGTHWCCSDP